MREIGHLRAGRTSPLGSATSNSLLPGQQQPQRPESRNATEAAMAAAKSVVSAGEAALQKVGNLQVYEYFLGILFLMIVIFWR